MLKKPKRIRDEKLILETKTLPCCVCGIKPVDAHHLISRGAGGHDIRSNLAPLCRKHHSLLHNYGMEAMKNTYPEFKSYLLMIGFDKYTERFKC